MTSFLTTSIILGLGLRCISLKGLAIPPNKLCVCKSKD